jgi:hypothetical protein
MIKNKFNYLDSQITELLEQGTNPTIIARELLSSDVGGQLNPQVKILAQYIRRHEKRLLDTHEGIINTAEKIDINYTSVKHLWHEFRDENGKKLGNAFIKNPDYVEPIAEEKNIIEDIEKAIENILSKFNKEDYIFNPNQHESNLKAIKITISDDHVGLEPNPNGNGLFKYEYNAEIYSNSYEKVFKSVVKEFNTHGKFDLILLDNLGDEQDGWSGLTTRGGHELPQNMTNAEVFETCIDVKVKMIKSLVENNIANKIILRKVANDNHSGDFGHTINLAVKKIINLIYSTDIIEVETLTQFLEHRIYGDHCFILTHGKDAKQMFRGLPLKLDDKTINYINDYIRFYDIKSKYIHVEKGDLHQIGYNKCNTFDYRNFMSFAPPSSWVQHNFGDCYSGYSIQVIPKYENEISHTDYFLNYKKIV